MPTLILLPSVTNGTDAVSDVSSGKQALTETREFDDNSEPIAYVLSANVHRRHLTKGQQAMAVALAYSEAKHGGDRKSSSSNKLDITDLGFSKASLSQARFVLRHCLEKAEEVLSNPQ
ncbi:MAG: hypothetical protein ABTQ93_02875 [Candidatus Competibacter denitrificans]